MRRDSAAILSILPLLAPAYALPTYFGNAAVVARSNVERAAEPAAVFEEHAAEAPEHWLPKEKRQGGITGLASSASDSGIEIDLGGEEDQEAPAPSKQTYTIPNISSQGRDHWLLARKAKAEAEADPAIALDMDYTPPPMDIGSPRLGAAGKARVRREADPVIALDMDYTPAPVDIGSPRLGAAGKSRVRREAEPAIALDMDYTPPPVDIGSPRLGAAGKARA
ncbi:MAG: hypothetical protein Q9174_005139 [Haloplaca sp. 1 TL-2023]